MQRSAVLLPEPLRPMMTATWPRKTSNETPSSTLSAPKLFCTFFSRMIGSWLMR